jgi:formylglycine-generating enzyme required for sulfatase activity
MLLPSSRTRRLAYLLLAIPLAALAVLTWAQDKPRSKEPITNSLKMKLVLIPAGRFTMGSPESEKDRNPNEKQHEVEIKEPFFLGIHEVRVGDFRAFVDDAGYKTEAEKAGDKETWQNAIDKQTDDHPVVRVTWNDAQAFCAWLSKKEGEKYRLPTEAEWEYACRAGTKTRFHNGDDDDAGLKEVANVGYYTTLPVGQLKGNAFGLYDMHGNVYEWCQDLYEQGGKDRVIRGGSWDWCDYRASCRSAARGLREPSNRHVYLGFRVARDSSGAK